jgi:serine/threonine protein phosphatase PrpC
MRRNTLINHIPPGSAPAPGPFLTRLRTAIATTTVATTLLAQTVFGSATELAGRAATELVADRAPIEQVIDTTTHPITDLDTHNTPTTPTHTDPRAQADPDTEAGAETQTETDPLTPQSGGHTRTPADQPTTNAHTTTSAGTASAPFSAAALGATTHTTQSAKPPRTAGTGSFAQAVLTAVTMTGSAPSAPGGNNAATTARAGIAAGIDSADHQAVAGSTGSGPAVAVVAPALDMPVFDHRLAWVTGTVVIRQASISRYLAGTKVRLKVERNQFGQRRLVTEGGWKVGIEQVGIVRSYSIRKNANRADAVRPAHVSELGWRLRNRLPRRLSDGFGLPHWLNQGLLTTLAAEIRWSRFGMWLNDRFPNWLHNLRAWRTIGLIEKAWRHHHTISKASTDAYTDHEQESRRRADRQQKLRARQRFWRNRAARLDRQIDQARRELGKQVRLATWSDTAHREAQRLLRLLPTLHARAAIAHANARKTQQQVDAMPHHAPRNGRPRNRPTKRVPVWQLSPRQRAAHHRQRTARHRAHQILHWLQHQGAPAWLIFDLYQLTQHNPELVLTHLRALLRDGRADGVAGRAAIEELARRHHLDWNTHDVDILHSVLRRLPAKPQDWRHSPYGWNARASRWSLTHTTTRDLIIFSLLVAGVALAYTGLALADMTGAAVMLATMATTALATTVARNRAQRRLHNKAPPAPHNPLLRAAANLLTRWPHLLLITTLALAGAHLTLITIAATGIPTGALLTAIAHRIRATPQPLATARTQALTRVRASDITTDTTDAARTQAHPTARAANTTVAATAALALIGVVGAAGWAVLGGGARVGWAGLITAGVIVAAVLSARMTRGARSPPATRRRHIARAILLAALLALPLLAGLVSSADTASAQPIPQPNVAEVVVPAASTTSLTVDPARGVALLPVGREISLDGAPAGPTGTATARLFTTAPHDTAGGDARGLGVSFDDLNDANGSRFSGPDEAIGSEQVEAPADWSGVWTTQRGDSYWRIYVQRFHDQPDYRVAVAADPNPNLIYPGEPQRIQQALEPGGSGSTTTTPGPTTTTPGPTTTPAPSAPTTHVAPPAAAPAPSGFDWTPLAAVGGAVMAILATIFGVRALRRSYRAVVAQARLVAQLGVRVRAAERELRRARRSGDTGAAVSAERGVRETRKALARGSSAAAATLRADQEISPARTERIVARAERGRGWVGRWTRLMSRTGWDLPASPGAATRWTGVSAALLGYGTGLAELSSATTLGWVANGLIAVGVVAATRAVWTPGQPRGPPVWVRLWERAHLLAQPRPAGLLVAGFVTAWSDPSWLAWLHAVLAPVVALPHYTAITAVASAVVVSGSLAFHDVLRRQLANQLKKFQTRPRVAAWRSAVLVALVSAAWKITADYGTQSHLSTLVFGSIGVGTAVIAVINALAQSKEMGRTRGIKALLAGVTALGTAGLTTWLIGSGHSSADFTTWVSALLLSGTVVSGNTPIGDYLTAKLARIGARIEKKRLEAAQGAGAKTTVDKRLTRFQAWLDLESSSAIDARLLARKVIGSIISALGSYTIIHPWSGTDTPAAIALRVGLVLLFIWATGKIRDHDAYRTKDDARPNYYGDQSSRTLRAPWRPSPLRGNRLRQRADQYRRELSATLELFGLASPDSPLPALDRNLVEQLAVLLFTRIASPVAERVDEWQPIPGADAANRALAEEEGQRGARQDQHRVAAVHTLMLLAADPAALARTAAAMRQRGLAGDAELAEVLEFQLMLGEHLLEQALANTKSVSGVGLLPAGSTRFDDWETLVDIQLTERARLRQEYLSGPRRRLLEAIITHFRELGQLDDPVAVEANAQLDELRAALQREALRKPPADPLSQIQQLHQQRQGSAGEAAAAEQHALDHSRGDQKRLDAHQELAGAHGLLAAAAGLINEVGFTRLERRATRQRWEEAITAALYVTNPSATPTSLLDLLLVVVGELDGPVTADQLAERFGGFIGTWQTRLNALRASGALTGQRARGYRAHPQLVAAWRQASPQLRRALRANPTRLPGGHQLLPLTQARPRAPPEQRKQAYRALLVLLRTADESLRRPRDTAVDDLGITWRRLAGIGYRIRHPGGRVAWTDPAQERRPLASAAHRGRCATRRLAHTVRQRARVPAQQRRQLAFRVSAAHTATRALQRLLLTVPALRSAGIPDPEIDRLLEAAYAQQVAAYALQSEARSQAQRQLAAARAYPQQTARTLRNADRVLATAPGADRTPDTAEAWLRELIGELNALRRELTRDATDARLARARTLLERYDYDRDYAWQRKLWRSWTGWRVMERARAAAEALETQFPQARAPAPLQPDHVPAVANVEVVPPPGQPDGTRTEPDATSAATTLRGPGNHINADAATTATLPDRSRAVLIADGLSSTPNAYKAAFAAITAARRELTRADRPGRSHRDAIRDAYQIAADTLAANEAMTNPHSRPDTVYPATTLLIAIVNPDGVITVGWVGDSRAYYLAANPRTASHQLTTDHTRAGLMTRWLSARRRPDLQLRTFHAPGPGLLLATTDGLHNVLSTPAQLHHTVNGRSGALFNARRATTLLTTAARARGSDDDVTAAAARVTTHRVNTQRPTASTGPVRRTGPPASTTRPTPGDRHRRAGRRGRRVIASMPSRPPVADRSTTKPGDGGLRTPPGSTLNAQGIAPVLRGDRELGADRRDELAGRLGRPVRLPGERRAAAPAMDRRWARVLRWVLGQPARAPGRELPPVALLRSFVAVTAAVLTTEGATLPWPLPLPPLRWLALDEPVVDPLLAPLAVDGGFRPGSVLGQGQVFPGWELLINDRELDTSPPAHAVAVHELAESFLAKFAGFTAAQRHAIATLAERAADPDADPDSWLPTWVLRELDLLAADNPAGLDRVIGLAQHGRIFGVDSYGVEIDIDAEFADLPAWRTVLWRYAQQYRDAAIARIPAITIGRAEGKRAIRDAADELRTMAVTVPGLKGNKRRWVRSARTAFDWNEALADGVLAARATTLKRAAARTGLQISEPQLVALGARWLVWGRMLDLNTPLEWGARIGRIFARSLPPALLTDPLIYQDLVRDWLPKPPA